MKKCVAICATLVALAWVGVAAAATPQGKLTGSADVFGATFTITTPVLDGGTSFVGLENDRSGNCNGDTGAVTWGGVPETIVCAHFVASSRDGSGPKMRFAIPAVLPSCYTIFRISDGGATDKVGGHSLCSLALAERMVNLGSIGGLGSSEWGGFLTVDGFTVTASQP